MITFCRIFVINWQSYRSYAYKYVLFSIRTLHNIIELNLIFCLNLFAQLYAALIFFTDAVRVCSNYGKFVADSDLYDDDLLWYEKCDRELDYLI